MCVVFGKIQCICVGGKDHVTCKVADACIGICSNIIKELMTCICHGFRALSLMGRDGTDGWKNGGVNHTSVIEDCADDALHIFDAFVG